MAKRLSKTHRRSDRARQARRKTERALSTLRKQGLVGKTEFRGKPSGAAYRVIRKYKDVVEGTAVAVKPKTRLIPGQLRKAYKERRGRLVVPKTRDTISTTVTRSRKGGVVIKRTRSVRGELQREIIHDPTRDIPTLPTGKVYRARMLNWGRESARYFSSLKNLNEFLSFYDNSVEWMDISTGDLPSGFQDDMPYGGPRPKRASRKRPYKYRKDTRKNRKRRRGGSNMPAVTQRIH